MSRGCIRHASISRSLVLSVPRAYWKSHFSSQLTCWPTHASILRLNCLVDHTNRPAGSIRQGGTSAHAVMVGHLPGVAPSSLAASSLIAIQEGLFWAKPLPIAYTSAAETPSAHGLDQQTSVSCMRALEHVIHLCRKRNL